MRIGKAWAIVLLAMMGLGWQEASACNYASKMRLYTKYLQRYIGDPSPGNASLLCNIVRNIEIKFKNTPAKPTPPIPAGLNCSAVNNGGGRGGGPGAVIAGVGQGVGSFLWVRNHHDEVCDFTWEITADPGNPAGFSLSQTTGMVNVPGQSSVPVLLDIMVAAGVPPGTMAFFKVEWIDACSGLPLFDDFADFKVTADAEISVVPTSPLFVLMPGAPLMMSWRVTNHTGAPVSRPYTYFRIGDPASVMAFNGGGQYDIVNTFLSDKSVSGGTADVPAFGEIIIDKVPLLPGEFCDPEMIHCCGLAFGTATSCGMVINDDLGPRPIPPLFWDLVGNPTGVGQIGFQIDGFNVQIPSDIGTPIPIQLDQLMQLTLDLGQNLNGFNFTAMLDGAEGMMLMLPPLLPFDFFSTDPGLQWQPLLPPILPLMEPWSNLELQVIELVGVVNGWAVPPLPPLPLKDQ